MQFEITLPPATVAQLVNTIADAVAHRLRAPTEVKTIANAVAHRLRAIGPPPTDNAMNADEVRAIVEMVMQEKAPKGQPVPTDREALLRVRDVAQLTGLSERLIWLEVRDGRFPAPAVKTTKPRVTRWRA